MESTTKSRNVLIFKPGHCENQIRPLMLKNRPVPAERCWPLLATNERGRQLRRPYWAKPNSLALHLALVGLGPASPSVRQFGLEDWRLSRPGLPHGQGHLWIARTQEPSRPDARNTIYRSRYLPSTDPRKTQKSGFRSGQIV